MAKINQQTLVITLSQMAKNDQPERAVLSADIVAQLEAVIAELAGQGVMVEIEQAWATTA